MEDNIDGQKILIENNILDLVFELCTELTQLDIESLSQEYTLDSVLSILYTTSKHPDLLNDALNFRMKGSLITTLKHIASLEMKTSDHLRLASFMSEVIKKNRFTGRTLSRNTKVFQWATALITKLNINSPYKLLPAFKIMEEFTKHIKDLKKDERKDLTKMIDSSRLLIKMTDIANIACPVKKKEAGKELYEAFIETVSNLIDMNAHISLNRDTSKKMLKLIKTIHGFEEFNRRKYIEHLTKIVEKFPCVDKNTINMLLDLGAEADTRNKVACVTGAVNCCISTTSYIDGKKIKYALVNMGKVEELDKDTKIDIIKLMINISQVEKLDENTKIDIINILIQFMIQDNLYYIFVEDDIDIILSAFVSPVKGESSLERTIKLYLSITKYINFFSEYNRNVISGFILKSLAKNKSDRDITEVKNLDKSIRMSIVMLLIDFLKEKYFQHNFSTEDLETILYNYLPPGQERLSDEFLKKINNKINKNFLYFTSANQAVILIYLRTLNQKKHSKK